jgi:hypothetical protein
VDDFDEFFTEHPSDGLLARHREVDPALGLAK